MSLTVGDIKKSTMYPRILIETYEKYCDNEIKTIPEVFYSRTFRDITSLSRFPKKGSIQQQDAWRQHNDFYLWYIQLSLSKV